MDSVFHWYADNAILVMYISVVISVLEYACPVWHTKLPKYISDNIALIQNSALKSIFPGKSYNDILVTHVL